MFKHIHNAKIQKSIKLKKIPSSFLLTRYLA